jgi:RNA polymerase sigma factor (sigma-70 family)
MTDLQFKHNYLTHSKALTNFAQKLTKDEFESQELVQIASIKAYKGRHTFKKGSNFKSWIFTILKNAFITAYHKRRRRNVVAAPFEDVQHASIKKFKVTNIGVSNLRLEEIKKCIAQLSPKSRKPFKLYLEGYPYKEISRDLDIPLGTVKSRINFARKKLKVKLKDQILAA